MQWFRFGDWRCSPLNAALAVHRDKMKDLANEVLVFFNGLLVSLDMKTSDYLTLLGTLVAIIALLVTYIWRKRDRRRKLIEEISNSWNSILDVTYKLRMDCHTLRQKYEYSEIKELGMQTTIDEYDKLIFKKIHDSAKLAFEAFQIEAPKLTMKELSQTQKVVNHTKFQLSNDANNFYERMSLAHEQLEKHWRSLKMSS